MHPSPYTDADFGRSPLMFYYEVTRACDLVCKHCRASAQESADPAELTTAASKALIEQAATFPRRPTLVLTGGDPLKRADLFDLIRHATAAGLQVGADPLGHAAGHPRGVPAGAGRRDHGLRHKPRRCGRGHARRLPRLGRELRADAPDVGRRPDAGHPGPSQHHDHPPQLRTRSTQSPNCSPAAGSRCGRSSSSCRWAAGWKRSGFRRRNMRSPSSGSGITPSASPTPSRRPRRRTIAASSSSRRRSAGRTGGRGGGGRRKETGRNPGHDNHSSSSLIPILSPLASTAPRWAWATARG